MRDAALSGLRLPLGRRTGTSSPIGFYDRGADVVEIASPAEIADFGASSAPMANTWQYMATEGA